MADAPKINPKRAESPKTESSEGSSIPPVAHAGIRLQSEVVSAYDSEQRKKDRRDKLKIRIEIATLAVVAHYTVIAGYQGCQLKKSTDSTLRLVDATTRQFRVDQRAWVKPHCDSLMDCKKVWLKNTGKTPARDVYAAFIMESAFEGQESPKFLPIPPETERRGLFFYEKIGSF